MTAAQPLARRLGSHLLLYGLLPVVTFLSGIGNLVVLTRHLSPGAYGRLGVLLTASGFLTILFNLGSLQGTFRVAFGAATASFEHTSDEQRRRAVGTGVVVTLAVAAIGCLVAALFAGRLDSIAGLPALIFALVLAVLGALWRLMTNLLRLERRAGWYVVTHTLRPTASLAASAWLVIRGYGIAGAIAGFALGTAASLLLTLVLTRRSYKLRFERQLARKIFSQGSPLIPVTLGFWAIESADILLLAAFATSYDVGIYRVGARIGGLGAYAASAYTMAWGPLIREPAYEVAERRYGRTALVGRLTTHLMVGVVSVVMGLVVFADDLARLADPRYAAAAGVLPILGLRWATKALLQCVYRAAAFANRVQVFAVAVSISGILFVAAAIPLILEWGTYGAAVASCVAPLVGTAIMRGAARKHGEGSPLDKRRLTQLVLITGGCWAAIDVLRHAGYGTGPQLGALLAYVVLILVTDTLPWRDFKHLARRGRAEAPPRAVELSRSDARLLRALAVEQASPTEVGTVLAMDEQEVKRRLVAVLREVIGHDGAETADDDEIGELLVSKWSQAERDYRTRTLWSRGVDPLEIEALQRAYADCRTASWLVEEPDRVSR